MSFMKSHSTDSITSRQYYDPAVEYTYEWEPVQLPLEQEISEIHSVVDSHLTIASAHAERALNSYFHYEHKVTDYINRVLDRREPSMINTATVLTAGLFGSVLARSRGGVFRRMTFPVLFGALAFGIQHPRTSKNIAFSIIDQIYEPKVREDHFNQLKQIPATVKQNTVDKAQQSLTKWADGVQEYLDKNWLNKKE